MLTNNHSMDYLSSDHKGNSVLYGIDLSWHQRLSYDHKRNPSNLCHPVIMTWTILWPSMIAFARYSLNIVFVHCTVDHMKLDVVGLLWLISIVYNREKLPYDMKMWNQILCSLSILGQLQCIEDYWSSRILSYIASWNKNQISHKSFLFIRQD